MGVKGLTSLVRDNMKDSVTILTESSEESNLVIDGENVAKCI